MKYLLVIGYFLIGLIVSFLLSDSAGGIRGYWIPYLIIGYSLYMIYAYFSKDIMYGFTGKLEPDKDEHTESLRILYGYGAIPIFLIFFIGWIKHNLLN